MRRFISGILMVGIVIVAGCAVDEPEVVMEQQTEKAVQVVMTTAAGDIVLELYPERAQITAENLLKYVDGGYFDGATFYRVVRPENNNGTETMQLIQGGIFGKEMAGGEMDGEPPFPPIAHETTEMSGLRHERGVISMGRLEPGTAASEFFILVTDAPELDFGGTRNPDGQGFAAFGRVIEGMDVVETIHRGTADVPTPIEFIQGQILDEPVVIRTARRR
jgi:peptidyl-prolyl cis-trans isomerase A (cyclophilin A)